MEVERTAQPTRRWWPRVTALTALLGPGVVIAIAGMGSSHFLLAPVAGALFGYALAWTIVLAHVIKYPAFEYATRYAVATGKDLLHGFADAPGPRNWAIWAFLVGIAFEGGIIIGGVGSVCAAVVIAAFPGIPFSLALVGVCALAGVFLWVGRYTGLERASILFLVATVLLTVAAALFARPDLGAIARGTLVPVLPAGAALTAIGLVGFMPAPLELAVMKSLWDVQRGVPATTPERKARRRDALLDLRVGYAASIVLGVVLLALSAALLAPRGIVPAGTGVFTTLAEIYSTTLGASLVPLYLLGAFFGMFSTVYIVLDAFPRATSAALTHVWRPPRPTPTGRDPRYWYTLYAMFIVGVLVVVVLPDPALLINLVSALTVLLAPVWYGLTVWSVHRLDAAHRPSRGTRVYARAGFAVMTAIAGVLSWSLLT